MKEQDLVKLSGEQYQYDIPENWKWIKLSELVKKMNSVNLSNFSKEEFRYIDIASVDNKNHTIRKYNMTKVTGAPSRASREVIKGDVLFSLVRPYLENIVYIEDFYDDLVASTGFFVSRAKNMILPKYLYYHYLSDYFINQTMKFMKGDNSPSIKKSNFENLLIPTPPLPEQQRIVDRIESLFEKINKAQALIEEAREGFEKRKEAILAKAFRGELTEKWREENTSYQSGKELIHELNKSRELKYNNKSKEAKKLKLRKPKSPRFLKEPINEVEDVSIPKSWVKSFIYEIGDIELGGTPSRKEQSYWNGTIPWLSSGEVANNSITSSRETITINGLDNSNAKLYPPGTILIAMIGEGKTRGQTAILEIEACTNQNVAAVIVNNSFICSKYVWYNFVYNYERNRSVGRGGNQPALNGQKVGELTISLPSYEEQIEIARILDDLYTEELRISELTSQYNQIDQLKKSILDKAFSGKLYTNDPKEASSLDSLKQILSKKH